MRDVFPNVRPNIGGRHSYSTSKEPIQLTGTRVPDEMRYSFYG